MQQQEGQNNLYVWTVMEEGIEGKCENTYHFLTFTFNTGSMELFRKNPGTMNELGMMRLLLMMY